MRDLHSLCSWLKLIVSSVAAVSRLTGMEISPKHRVPFHTLCGALSLPPGVKVTASPSSLSAFCLFAIYFSPVFLRCHDQFTRKPCDSVMRTVKGLQQ